MRPSLVSTARFFHRAPLLRRLARVLVPWLAIRQRFHGAVIFLNAVDHSWSWTGGRPMDTFDRDLQDHLLSLVASRGRLIDVGCNIGVMSLSVLLRDPKADVVCVDPNVRAIRLLKRSLRLNGLDGRATPLCAAVSGGEAELRYDQHGSFIGHVSTSASPVPTIPLDELLRRYATKPVVLKIDVEGYETRLVDTLARASLPAGSVALMELHPAGYNGMGDPRRVIARLAEAGLNLRLLDGVPLEQCEPSLFHQLQIDWPA